MKSISHSIAKKTCLKLQLLGLILLSVLMLTCGTQTVVQEPSTSLSKELKEISPGILVVVVVIAGILFIHKITGALHRFFYISADLQLIDMYYQVTC